MHIHWIANSAPDSMSGGDRIAMECIRRWAREHRISLYGWEGTRELYDRYHLEGIEHVLWSAQVFRSTGLLGLFLAQTWIGWRRARQLHLPPEEKNLVVSSSDFLPESLPGLVLKRRHPSVPWVAAFYLFAPPLSDWFRGKPGPGPLFSSYRPIQQWMLRWILREAEVILTTGEEDRERMIRLGRCPESVVTVRGGVDLSVPRSVPEPSEKTYDAVFVGRLHPQKGVLELVDIWQLVAKTLPRAKLALIGNGPLEQRLRSKVKQKGLIENVEFKGFVDGVEKYRVIKASRVVVHPAIYDSGGMAPAEALACGLPGVAFDLPSLKTYYPKGFLKAGAGDLQEFAGHILHLLKEPDLYAKMSAEARAAGAEWDWDARAQQILDAILHRLQKKETLDDQNRSTPMAFSKR